MAEDDYELMPEKEIKELKKEVELLKKNPLGDSASSKDLFRAVDRLTVSLNNMMDLFKTAKERGFTMDTTSLALPGSLQAGQKYGFLLAAGGMPPMTQGRGDFLPDATSLAIEHLSQGEKGFFLMVEGSQIDWGGHANNTEYVVTETLDFEKTVAAALDFARKDGNTLVVVTADHETGGFSLSALRNEETGSADYKEIGPTFAISGHSATLIPVFAYGPGAENFKGMYENTELFHKMKALVNE